MHSPLMAFYHVVSVRLLTSTGTAVSDGWPMAVSQATIQDTCWQRRRAMSTVGRAVVIMLWRGASMAASPRAFGPRPSGGRSLAADSRGPVERAAERLTSQRLSLRARLSAAAPKNARR